MVLEPKKMKVGEMREALQARGLDTSGLKNDLIHRLEMALDEEEFGVSEAPPTNAAATVVAADPVVEPAVENSVAVETPVAAVAAEESVPAAGPVDVPVVTNKNAERAARFGIPVVEAAPAEKLKEGLEKKSGGDKNNGKQRGGKLSEPVSVGI
jgi:SAP domain-containing ribonucleoprotein